MKFLGSITSIKDNVIICNDYISSSYIGEVLLFQKETVLKEDIKCQGIVFEIGSNELKILLIKGFQQELYLGDYIYSTSSTLQVKVGFSLLGKTINPFGVVLYNHNNSKSISDSNIYLEEFFHTGYLKMTSGSPGIIERKKVAKPLLTGIYSIDCLFPIGLGQRQLIIGDNNTGKTSLAISSILNQKASNLKSKYSFNLYYKFSYLKPCIYVSIGQKRSEVIRIQKVLNDFDSSWYTSIIFSGADDLPVIQYYAPYIGSIIGEWFMHRGYDGVLVFDDLSKHSVAYRQITLLLRRPPGREAFPGDIFFLHSKLLEKCAQLSSDNGEGSLTCLPIIETLCGDVASYIPTNVISITDGQIFLNKELLNRGTLPAVDLNLSVSRVGASSQYKFMVSISKLIKMQLSFFRQFKDAELLGSGIGESIKRYISRGKRLMLLFKQPLFSTQSYLKQILFLFTLANGLADNISLRLTKFFLASIFNLQFYRNMKDPTLFVSLFKDFDICENNLAMLDYDTLKDSLIDLLSKYVSFFEKIIVPIITDFKDQSYIWNLVDSYKSHF